MLSAPRRARLARLGAVCVGVLVVSALVVAFTHAFGRGQGDRPEGDAAGVVTLGRTDVAFAVDEGVLTVRLTAKERVAGVLLLTAVSDKPFMSIPAEFMVDTNSASTSKFPVAFGETGTDYYVLSLYEQRSMDPDVIEFVGELFILGRGHGPSGRLNSEPGQGQPDEGD